MTDKEVKYISKDKAMELLEKESKRWAKLLERLAKND